MRGQACQTALSVRSLSSPFLVASVANLVFGCSVRFAAAAVRFWRGIVCALVSVCIFVFSGCERPSYEYLRSWLFNEQKCL